LTPGPGRTKKAGGTPAADRGTDMSDIADRVKKIVVEHLGVEETR
jgi:hypothetical protein